MLKRRDVLKQGLVGLGALVSAQLPLARTLAQTDESEPTLELTGAILNVHDPVMIKEDDSYYVFSTGVGIPVKRSTDLKTWRVAKGGTVFQKPPTEALAYVPGATDIWAPDISYYNDRYHLYYSVSTFGSNHSAIGLATNKTLKHGAEGFKWEDHGIVVKSDYDDDFNAIDPNLILDANGDPWLTFGSHWGGIKMIKLDKATGKQSTEDDTLYALAARAEHPRAIEAPFIIRKNDYYYLFVSFDQCCQGIASNYNVRVGRSTTITGPYVDRNGVPMLEDGGTQITAPADRYRGPGHNGIFSEADRDYIVYHAYDAVQGGTPTLRIEQLVWDADGWLAVPSMLS